MMSWSDVFVLFIFMWVIVRYLKEIRDNLSYLIELLEQKSDLVNKQADQNKEQDKGLDSKIPSREDLYK